MNKLISKEDLKIAKAFISYPYPEFVTALSLDMDIDYLVGLCTRFIKKEKSLNHNLCFFDDTQEKAINNYIDKQGSYNCRIFYQMVKAIEFILQKYYDNNGNWKII